MRALKSGRMRAISRRLRAAWVPARERTAAANSSASRTFSLRGETESVPGFRGRKSSSARAPMRAAAMPASEISNAMAGGASCNSDLSMSIRSDRERAGFQGEEIQLGAGADAGRGNAGFGDFKRHGGRRFLQQRFEHVHPI